MFSKTTLKRMVPELSVSTLVCLFRETLDEIGEELTEESADIIGNLELFAAELRRRIPEAPPKVKRSRTIVPVEAIGAVTNEA